jgi:hypothetical protein
MTIQIVPLLGLSLEKWEHTLKCKSAHTKLQEKIHQSARVHSSQCESTYHEAPKEWLQALYTMWKGVGLSNF